LRDTNKKQSYLIFYWKVLIWKILRDNLRGLKIFRLHILLNLINLSLEEKRENQEQFSYRMR
jgi:hypothetical protein